MAIAMMCLGSLICFGLAWFLFPRASFAILTTNVVVASGNQGLITALQNPGFRIIIIVSAVVGIIGGLIIDAIPIVKYLFKSATKARTSS